MKPKETDTRRVLVVEDDAEFRRSLCKILQKAGYSVTGIASGKRASEIIAQRAYPLVISDLNLPGKSGMNLLMEIKRKSPESRVIILTVNGETEIYNEAMQKGAFAFLSKPVKMRKILSYAGKAFANSI